VLLRVDTTQKKNTSEQESCNYRVVGFTFTVTHRVALQAPADLVST